MSPARSDQQRKLQAVNIGTVLQKVDGIALLITAAVHDGDELESEVMDQFRVTLARLSHLVESAYREQEQERSDSENEDPIPEGPTPNE